MKTYSSIMLAVYVIIEILAIILFIMKEITALGFILNVVSMSLMIGLVMMYRHKSRKNDKA